MDASKLKLLEKLAKEESDFLSSQILSPVLPGKPIRVRIAGIICNLKVQPKKFAGWGVFEAVGGKSQFRKARFVREPNMSEKKAYLEIFPALRLIICRRVDDIWYGIPSSQADTRFVIKGLVPIRLAEEVQLFETVCTRFDGVNCWFDSVDSAHNPRTAIYLRECLTTLVEPSKIELSGLTLEERDAYLMAYGPALEADIESKKDKQEERIKSALIKAGANYQSYIERGNTYTIEFTVDGDRHRSVVRKEDLQIESAGICLSGGDRTFDLTSLVGVLRQGRRTGRIVRTDNYHYDDD